MATFGANSLSIEQRREISALLEGNQLSVENIALLQQAGASSDPVQCEKVLDQINDSLIDFALQFASTTDLDLSSKSLTRISPKLLAFLEKNYETLKTIDLTDNALMSLSSMYKFKFPNLNTLSIANNPLLKIEEDQVRTSFPLAFIKTELEPQVTLPASLGTRSKPHTPHYAKTQDELVAARNPKEPGSEKSVKPGFFKKLFKF